MSAADNKATVRRFYESFPHGSKDLISDEYEPSLRAVRQRNVGEDAPMPIGKMAWDLERDLYHAVLGDLRFEIREMAADGNMVIAVITVHGTPDHPLEASRGLVAVHTLSGGQFRHVVHHWMDDRPFDESLAHD